MIHIVKAGESLAIIAANYRISLNQLIAVNKISNPNIIYIGQQINIPSLPNPDSIPYSIHISVSSKRLILKREGQVVREYPIAVGKIVTATPVGDFVIVNREPNPGGPFGVMWLSLSKIHYGIHGTNNPASIGKAVSLGCIRMYNNDVLELASMVPNGTRVFIRP
ncbi:MULTISPECIES: L,D-transpeptidase family protein [Metabacillus]|jgi:L,D-transpeptidase ErfK/SrfK|uniref:L,D-transpeptidase n=2 Tax=Metabacillus TaxID=2675233 RepID=A0A179SZ66_9BACI|nr:MULTISPECIES: L,D-transpeptidase family protein [Metabacillus]OAS86644.1 L,D-transpeptidase [Metabacillus litoralis]QNF29284.1 L,D-transpeptidase family protein [Metabacillus sp. KUDC1714]